MLTAKSLDSADRGMLKERVLGLIEKHGLDREALIREIRRALPVEECATAPVPTDDRGRAPPRRR